MTCSVFRRKMLWSFLNVTLEQYTHAHKNSIPSTYVWTRNAFRDMLDLLGDEHNTEPEKKRLVLPGFRGAERPSSADVKMLCHIFQHIPWSSAVERHLRQRDFCLTSQQVTEVLHLLKGNMGNAFNFFIWAGQQRGYCYGIEALNVLREVFEQNLGDVGSMLGDMEKDGRFIPMEALMILVDLYASKNMTEEAVEIFHGTRKYGCRPDEDAYNLILKILVGTGRIEVAQEIFEQMKHDRYCCPDNSTLGIILYGLGKAGKVAEAHKVLESVRCGEELLAVEAHVRLVEGLCEGGRMGQAEEVIIEMYDLGLEPDINVYTSLTSAYAKAGNMVEAYRYYMEGVKDKDLTNNTDVVSTLILGFCTVNDVGAACKLLKEVICNGFSPDINLYNGIIKAASEQGLWHVIQELLDEMTVRGINPNAESYDALIASCVDVWPEKALVFLNQMTRKGFPLTKITLAALISGLSEANQPNEWFKFLEIIEGLVESKLSKGDLYKSFFTNLTKENEEVAANVFRLMEEKGFLDGAVIALKKDGMLEDLRPLLPDFLCKSGI